MSTLAAAKVGSPAGRQGPSRGRTCRLAPAAPAAAAAARTDSAFPHLSPVQADNMYYPPGWDPSKGSLNKFHGSHGALGDRARKLKSEGILIIRFEMPFNVWCGGCNHLIGKVGAASCRRGLSSRSHCRRCG